MGHVHRFARAPDLMHASSIMAQPRPERPWKRGLAWLALLGPFFFASYGLANWSAASRSTVGSIVFAWEQAIPFVAWTIVPYWSIDLLYGLSLLAFATRRELDRHAWRLLTAQLIAVACFIAFPLRFSLERPQLDGLAGWLFAALEGFDRPFNQAPSLHLALTIILWAAYANWVRGPWRAAMHASFALIGVSALTTWQHHFIDIPTGIWLGWFCVWLYPAGMRAPFGAARLAHDPVRRRLALRYGLAALAVAVLAISGGGAWLWLLWVCGSLALVGAIYALGDAWAFQKRADGSMSAAALWLLWPYFLGAWLNARWWTRKSALVDALAPQCFIGRSLGADERARCGIAAIVDVCAELPCSARPAAYACVPMLDLVRPTCDQIERACREIDRLRAAGPVAVCCALGFSRSAVVAAAWLLRSQLAASVEAAVEQVRRARPHAVLGEEHLCALREWRERCAPFGTGRGRP